MLKIGRGRLRGAHARPAHDRCRKNLHCWHNIACSNCPDIPKVPHTQHAATGARPTAARPAHHTLKSEQSTLASALVCRPPYWRMRLPHPRLNPPSCRALANALPGPVMLVLPTSDSESWRHRRQVLPKLTRPPCMYKAPSGLPSRALSPQMPCITLCLQPRWLIGETASRFPQSA